MTPRQMLVNSLTHLLMFCAIVCLVFGGESLRSRVKALESHQRPTELQQGFTVLVGTGCDGPSPIAVAVEEDLLPTCDAIEVHQVAIGDR